MESLIGSARRDMRGIIERCIVDDARAGSFKVNRRVFVDEAILALERRALFDRCWLYVCHASELAQPGRFLTRKVGGRNLLVTRDADGGLNVFYNTCTHRGALVCRERGGQRRHFTCPYHGWVFDNRGRLADVPRPEAMAPGLVAGGSLDLRRVPRMDSWRDFVFVCFDREGRQSLADYLAGAREVLDIVGDQGEQGMEVIGGMQEYCMKANWKLLQENSADGYHALTTHATYFDYVNARDGDRGPIDPKAAGGRVWDLGGGHAVLTSTGTMPWGRPYARWVPGWGEEAKAEVEAIAHRLVERLGEERAIVVGKGDRNCLIFPNLVVNDIMAVTIRTFYPVRPDYIEINAWALAPKEESAASRDRRNRNFLEFLGPAGFATPDDVEMLELCQAGYANIDGLEWNDISRGMMNPEPVKTDESQMRTFWREWQRRMLEESARPECP